jgi:outer membrane protein assembly factor BamB
MLSRQTFPACRGRYNAVEICSFRAGDLPMKWLLVLSLNCVLASSVRAEDWPAFRGPHGNGTTTQPDTPLHWSASDGILWSAPLPRGGNGSPIVVANQVLLTSAEDEAGKTRTLLSFDADTGKPLWQQPVTIESKMPTHKTNPYGGSTPASDGKRVVVWHGSAGLHAYDLQGNPLWSRALGEYRHMWGYGSSPVIVGDRVILHTGPGQKVFVLAFDLESGEELWRHEEPIDGNGERNADNQYMGSWATPVVIKQPGDRRVAVVALATRVCGFDVNDGKVLWSCEGLAGERGDLAYSSPLIEGQRCVMFGGFKGPSIGFQITGEGERTERQRLWRETKNPQNIGTGLMLGGYVYRVGAGPNLIDCIEAENGNVVWQQRWNGKAFWSSIAYDGNHAYATDQAGTTVVFKPSTGGFREVARNKLDDTCNATPALAKGRVYIRTYEKLWCIDGQ